jgi:hypothetical protein
MPRGSRVPLLSIPVLLLALSVAATAQPRPEPPSAPAMRFTRIAVRDPGINNIEALSILVPVGWTTEGGVQWFPDYSILANLLLRIGDPESGAVIEFLPVQNFTWLTQMAVPMTPGTNYLGNILWQPIGDIPRFIQTFYMPHAMTRLREARVVGVQDLPWVAAAVGQAYGGQARVKSARIRYEYAVNDQPWEEEVNSVRISPEWYGGYMYVRQLFNNRMNQSIKNAAAISQTITRNREEIRRMYGDSYRQRQASQDRISQSWSEHIRGVETYQNPFDGRPVQLPGGYSQAWVNARGEYLLTNQAGFNPNVGDTTEWRRMDRRP